MLPKANMDDDAQRAPPSDKPPRKKKRRRALFIALGVVVAALVVAGLLGFEPLVRHLVVEQARERGIVLTLGEIHLGWSKVRLERFRCSLVGVDGVSAEVAELTVRHDGLTPTSVVAHGIDVSVQGSAATLALGLGEWTKNHPQLVRIPAGADGVNLRWRAQPSAEPWLHITDALVQPTEAGGHLVALRAEVAGIDVGKVGASWAGDSTHIAFGFGEEDLGEAPVLIDVQLGPTEPQAEITLRPTPLAELAAPLGVALPVEGVTASGSAVLRFAEGLDRGAVDGSIRATFKGYRPPAPPELKSLVFGDTTELKTELEVSADRRTIRLTSTELRHGTLTLAGQGQLDRHAEHTAIGLELDGELRCTDVAGAAVQSRLGRKLGGLLGGVTRWMVHGSIAIGLKIEADSRDLSAARVTPKLGVGCGLGPRGR